MRTFVTTWLILLALPLCAQPSLLTPYEKGDGNHTPRLAETLSFCRELTAASPMVSLTSIGASPQGREIPLLIVDKDGLRTPQAIRTKGRAVVLIEACIHAGEPDGKDAGLMLLRDIVCEGKYVSLLDQVSILFLPIFNVDGHEDFSAFKRINQNGPEELGNRNTAQRINLNRDFLKADAPEMRHWLKLYNDWLPELFIDVHVTNGADFQYVTTYGIEDCGFMDASLIQWNRQVFDPQLNQRMEADGYPIFPYFGFVRRDQPESGVILESFPPQYSTGYAAVQNRMGILVENHIYKPYPQRVDATYRFLYHSLALIAENRSTLQGLISQADRHTASSDFRKELLTLNYTPTRTDSIPCTFLGWERITDTSYISGAPWTRHDYTAPLSIPTHRYTSYQKGAQVKLPQAYIFPPELMFLTELLNAHKIEYKTLSKDDSLMVESYRFTGAEWARYPNEGRITVKAQHTTQTEKVFMPQGSIIVSMDQPRAKLIAHILEPDGPTSMVYWGFFNSYVRPTTEFWISLNYMEVKGREMMAKDLALKQEFEAKKASDPEFAANPQAILQFFMTKVRQNVEPYANMYPVVKQY